MAFIKYTKDNLIKHLPEKRPGMIFVEPDLFIKFGFHETMVIFDNIVDNLSLAWKENLDIWDTTIDFRKNEDDDMSKYKQCFKSIDFGAIPIFSDNELDSPDQIYTPFAFNEIRELYINLDFIDALQHAGSVDIWYDSLK